MTDAPRTGPDAPGGASRETGIGPAPSGTAPNGRGASALRAGGATHFALTLTRALLESVDLRRILYVILSGATAGDGLGFNRALLFLEDPSGRLLRGQLAVGPETRADAQAIWEAMEAEHFDLGRVMRSYDAFDADARAARLTRWVERVTLRLPAPEAQVDATPHAAPARASHSGTVAAPTEAPEEHLRLEDLLSQVVAQGRAMVIPERPVWHPGLAVPLGPTAAAPLVLAGRVIGVLVVDNAFNGRPISAVDQQDLQTLADLAAVAVERAQLHERLQRMAEQDGLTGLLNRRSFEERFARLHAMCRRRGDALSILLVDADHFKAVNDRLGHLVGDRLLQRLAGLLQTRIRRGDLAGRYGGDEFIVALAGAGESEALRVAEALCRAARTLDLLEPEAGGAVGSGAGAGTVPETAQPPGSNSPGALRPSVSVGVAGVRPEHASLADVVAAADRALYTAKAAGRGRARIAGSEAAGPARESPRRDPAARQT